MTRKARKTRKGKSKRKSRRYKIKGGAFLPFLAKAIAPTVIKAASDPNLQKMAGQALGTQTVPEPETAATIANKPKFKWDDAKQVLKFSLGAILISPLYIATVLANLPLNTIHNLSNQNLDDKTSDAVGIQLYKYLFEGYTKEVSEKGLMATLNDKNKFDIPTEYNIKKSVVVKCDNCIKRDKSETDKPEKDKSETVVQKGGYMNTYKTFKEIIGIDPFKGKIGKTGIDKVDNFIKTATDIKIGNTGIDKVDAFTKSITEYFKSQNGQIIHKLKELEYDIDSIKDDFIQRKQNLKPYIKNLKTELLFKYIVVCQTIINECKETTEPVKVKVTKDLVLVPNPYRMANEARSRFTMDVCFLKNNCKEECPNCTFFNNIVSIYHSYARILLSTLRGKTNNLYVIIDLIFTILKSAHNGVKPVIVLDDITTMKYEGDFKDVKKSLDGPIKLFTETICKYGMYDEMKRVFGDRVKKLDNDPDKKKLLLNNLNSII